MSRKCSLAIESPMETNGSNYPLNAFLVYNNPVAVSPCSSTSSCSSSPNASAVVIADNSSPPPPHRHNHSHHLQHRLHHGMSRRHSSLGNVPVKSHSLPNLNSEDNYTHHLGNRRISICDLNNFNDEVYNVCSNHYSNLSTSDLTKPDDNSRISGGDNTMIQIDKSLHSFKFRNHKRRNSIALRFEAPKVL